MIQYKKFQFGWVIIVTFLAIIIFMILAYIHQWGNNPLDIYGLFFFLALFGGILMNFYGMTIIVTNKEIKIKLGIGLYTKKIDIGSIRSVNTITYPFYCGYGIRFTTNGILYNVSGNHAIEIKFKNIKNNILIGTNDWQRLRETIDKNMNRDNQHYIGD